MPGKNEDLHGNVPDKADVALVLIDVINDMEFPEGAQLLEHALPMAERIAELKKRAREAGIPTIYVNDNFGRWKSDFNAVVEHCLQDKVRGQALAEKLRRKRMITSFSKSSIRDFSQPRSTFCLIIFKCKA